MDHQTVGNSSVIVLLAFLCLSEETFLVFHRGRILMEKSAKKENLRYALGWERGWNFFAHDLEEMITKMTVYSPDLDFLIQTATKAT